MDIEYPCILRSEKEEEREKKRKKNWKSKKKQKKTHPLTSFCDGVVIAILSIFLSLSYCQFLVSALKVTKEVNGAPPGLKRRRSKILSADCQ